MGKQLQLRWVGRKQSVSYQVQVAPRQDFQHLLLDAKTPFAPAPNVQKPMPVEQKFGSKNSHANNGNPV
jgi:hypothetical protein